MGIMKDNTNTYLLFGIIVCILIGCILILLKDKKVFKKNEMVIAAKDKLKHISKVKKMFLISGLVIAIIISIIIIILMTIDCNKRMYSTDYGVACGTSILMNSVEKTINTIIVTTHVYIVVFHILWMLFENLYYKKKIKNNNQFNEKEKAILIEAYSTSNLSIVGYAIICQVIPLALRILL